MPDKAHEDTMRWMYSRAAMFGPYPHERETWDREWTALSAYDKARVEAVAVANRFTLSVSEADLFNELQRRCREIDEAEKNGGAP